MSQVDNGSDVKQEKKEKKRKRGGDEVVLVYPEKAKSLKAKIRNCVMKILKDVDVINEKDLVLRLIFECEPAKEYYKRNNDTSYLRFIIWDMARKGMIKRARIFGEGSRRYYLLPEKLEVLKDRVIGESD